MRMGSTSIFSFLVAFLLYVISFLTASSHWPSYLQKTSEKVNFNASEPVVILGFGQMGQVDQSLHCNISDLSFISYMACILNFLLIMIWRSLPISCPIHWLLEEIVMQWGGLMWLLILIQQW